MMAWTFRQTAAQIQGVIADLGGSAFDLVLPSCCRLCFEPTASRVDFCAECQPMIDQAEAMMVDACQRCGRPPTRLVVVGHSPDVEVKPSEFAAGAVPQRCRHCQKEQYAFDEVVALWPYHDKICEIVVATKYSSRLALADAIGRRLGRKVAAVYQANLPDFVVNIPSHFTRQAVRGGTSTRTIAEAVAKEMGRRHHEVLKMTRRVEKQAWLDDRERITNVREAFAVKPRFTFRGLPDLTDRHILLVDDVLTTGATAGEATRVLRASGAQRVTLAVIARALRG